VTTKHKFKIKLEPSGYSSHPCTVHLYTKVGARFYREVTRFCTDNNIATAIKRKLEK